MPGMGEGPDSGPSQNPSGAASRQLIHSPCGCRRGDSVADVLGYIHEAEGRNKNYFFMGFNIVWI